MEGILGKTGKVVSNNNTRRYPVILMVLGLRAPPHGKHGLVLHSWSPIIYHFNILIRPSRSYRNSKAYIEFMNVNIVIKPRQSHSKKMLNQFALFVPMRPILGVARTLPKLAYHGDKSPQRLKSLPQ